MVFKIKACYNDLCVAFKMLILSQEEGRFGDQHCKMLNCDTYSFAYVVTNIHSKFVGFVPARSQACSIN